MSAILYELPSAWLQYDRMDTLNELIEAKVALTSLTSIPYERNWVEKLQEFQLKMEVAGTSRIEGADFTDNELDAALQVEAKREDLLTRSQRQAHAAVNTYRWISALPQDRPIDARLVKEIHSRIVRGCDDDRCSPGVLRKGDENVTFGSPRHRGCEGGDECERAFERLMGAVSREFHAHDPLIQALALHYHLAAMHPFLDGNGRTARAVEALVLQRVGLRDTAFIAMSNYYYDEKPRYLQCLALVRANNHDLTPFLKFGLLGIALQCQRLAAEIRKHIAKALFRNLMYDLFNRLPNKRSRVIRDRQLEILKILLDVDQIELSQLIRRIQPRYAKVANFAKALLRDLAGLENLNAIRIESLAENRWKVFARLEWPSEITESEFFIKIRQMPKGRTYRFLQ